MEIEHWKPVPGATHGTRSRADGERTVVSERAPAWHRPTLTRLAVEQTLSVSGPGVDALSPGSQT
jgi:hypothetical protein